MCCERAPSPFPVPGPAWADPSFTETLARFQAPGLPWIIPLASGHCSFRAQPSSQGAARMQLPCCSSVQTPLLCSLRVSSCIETTIQGIAVRKLEKDTSEELLGVPQVFLPAVEEGENCQLQKYYSLCCETNHHLSTGSWIMSSSADRAKTDFIPNAIV